MRNIMDIPDSGDKSNYYCVGSKVLDKALKYKLWMKFCIVDVINGWI